MSAINDGGPAFPSANNVRCGEFQTNGHAGMSLRDHFAASRPAPADLSRAWGEAVVREFPKDGNLDMQFGREVALWWADVEAAWSYMQADALLRARANSTPN